MISGKQPILLLNQSCSDAVIRVTNQLNVAGYAVVKTFDLLSALAKCPNRIGQMVILLVYGQNEPPTTFVIEGNDFISSISVENDRDQSSQSMFIPLLAELSNLDQPSEVALNEGTERNTPI